MWDRFPSLEVFWNAIHEETLCGLRRYWGVRVALIQAHLLDWMVSRFFVVYSVIGKYIRQAQNELCNLRSASTFEDKNPDNNLEDYGTPILEELLLNHGMQPEDVATLMMDMIILGVQAVSQHLI